MILLFIIVFIPLGEVAEAFTEGDLRGEAEVALQGGGISVGNGYIAGLHGDQFLVGIEVEVLGEDTGTYQLFLEDIDEVQEVLGLAATYIIYCIGRNGQAILAFLALGGSLHHTHDALDDVIDIGEVSAAVAIVEDLYRFALQELVGEAEVCHIRTTSRAIDREEAKARCGDVI